MLGWETAPEVSSNIRGERGTIDILAFHAATGSLPVLEIKSVVPDLQAITGAPARGADLTTVHQGTSDRSSRTNARVVCIWQRSG